MHRRTHKRFFDKTQTPKEMTSNNSSIATCIRCHGNVFTEPLSCDNRRVRIHIYAHRQMGGIYEVRHWECLICHNVRTKFRKDLFRHLEADGGGGDTVAQTGLRSRKPTLASRLAATMFRFQNMKLMISKNNLIHISCIALFRLRRGSRQKRCARLEQFRNCDWMTKCTCLRWIF
jgi:hypothetical protein